MQKNIFKKIISFSFLILFLISLVFPIISSAQIEQGSMVNDKWNNNTLYLGFNSDKLTSNSVSFNIYYQRDGGDNATRNVNLTILKSGANDPTKTQNATITLTKDLSTKEYIFSNLDYSTKYYVTGTIEINNQTSIESSLYFTTLAQTTNEQAGEQKWWYDQTAQWSGAYTKSQCIPLAEAFDKTPKPVCKYFTGDPNETNPIDFQIITPTETGAKTEENYYPLAPLPGVGETNCDKSNCDATGQNCTTTCIKLGTQKCTTVAGKETCVPCGPTDKGCTPGTGFASYLNMMIQIFIGICAVLAMIMIVMGGIEYMTSELVSSKQAGKDRILHAILGLILALGSYAILNTLNPDLLNINLSSVEQAIVTAAESAHQEQVIQNLGNNQTFKRTKYYNCIKTLVGNKYNHCIMQAMVQIESGGLTSQIIGHDENVKNKDIKSRRDFVASGITFLKKTFTPTNDVTTSQQNDDGTNSGPAPKPNQPDLGLDLRFSHSVGMFGLTFFPPNGNPTDGSGVKMQDIYNNTNDADIKWAINHAFNAWKACGNSQGVFYYWGAGGNCKAPAVDSWNYKIAAQKQNLYQQCVTQDTDTTPVTNTCPK